MIYPDTLPPEFGWPLAVVLWVALLAKRRSDRGRK